MKRIVAVMLLLVLCCGLAGCYDAKEVDDLAYVLAIGLDQGQKNAVKVTMQLAVPNAIGGSGGGGGGGGGGGKTYSIITMEAPTLTSSLNMANNFLSRRLELSHAEVAVFSEDLAKSGTIVEYLRGMIRSRGFRPTINLVVCKGKAEEYLKSIKPTLDLDPAKYYELTFSAYRYTGLSVRSQLTEFYSDIESSSVQAVAVLAGVNKSKPPKGGQSGSSAQGAQSGGGDQSGGSGDSAQGEQSGGSAKESQAGGAQKEAKPEESTSKSKGRPQPFEGDYEAGSIPRTGDVKGEIEGLAVFDGGRMVGEMDGEAATDYLLVNGQFHTAYKTFADPEVTGTYVVLNVSQKSKPVRRVKIVGGKPQISVQIAVDADIETIQSGYNYEDTTKLPILEQAAEAQLKDEIVRFLGRTTGEFHSDICGFGKDASGLFLTWKDWENYHWLQQYKDATFNVGVRVKIRRPGMILKSGPITSSGGASMQ